MKTKLFLAALAVTFSLAMTSCGGNKAANATDGVDSTAVACPATETAACCKADSAACDTTKACCQDKQNCPKADQACCKDKKAACDKK